MAEVTADYLDQLEERIPEIEERIKDVHCPQCRKEFQLKWNDFDDEPITLLLRGCPSGGIYDVRIRCPHCDYEEEL